ncbi:MAG TPA: ABC transporter substrate-binding protein, partial [Candidatus Dormibacteraeota bacterium]|nr:ABC transporter substrate-binding protein [Candidatus Dormibacteraeota bacterium]
MRKAGFLVALVLLVSACGSGGGGATSPTGGAPKTGGTLKISQETEINTLDPGASGLLVEREIYYNMYESLLGIDAKLNFVPELAASWKYTDPTTLVFTLRQGVKFQDGTDFNADAVKFNIDRYMTASDSARKSDLASVQSVEAQGPNTAVFHLKHPDATLLAQLVDRAGMMLSPTAVQQVGAKLGVNPVGAGTGPFEFVEWQRDDHLTLKRNPNYWRKDAQGRRLPYLDQVVYRPMTDLNAILASLQTGDVDVARTVAGKDVATVKADSSLVYKSTTGLGYANIELNVSAPPFNDPAKAKAVALAVDRAEILQNIAFGIGTISYGPITAASWAYDPTEKIYDKADPVKAKATATGFSFTLKTGNTQDNLQEGQLIQAELAKAGITVNLLPEEFAKLTLETRVQHQFQGALSGWSGRIDPDGNMYAFFHTGG